MEQRRRWGKWSKCTETKNVSRSRNATLISSSPSFRKRKPPERLKRGHKWKVPMDSSVFCEANILRLSPHCGVRRAWLRRRFISSLFRRLILTNTRKWNGLLHFSNSILVKIWSFENNLIIFKVNVWFFSFG